MAISNPNTRNLIFVLLYMYITRFDFLPVRPVYLPDLSGKNHDQVISFQRRPIQVKPGRNHVKLSLILFTYLGYLGDVLAGKYLDRSELNRSGTD